MKTVEAKITWWPTPSGGELGVDEEPRPPFVGLRSLHPRADALVELDGEGGEETGNVVGVVVRWFLAFEAWEAIPQTGKLWRQEPRHPTHPAEALPLVEFLKHKQRRLRERDERGRQTALAAAERRRSRGEEPSLEDVRLDFLEALIEVLPELEEEWPDLLEGERFDIDYEWSIDTHQIFGALETLDRGVSPWPNTPGAALDAAQRERYTALKRALREAMPVVERLGLSTWEFPDDVKGR